MAILLLIRHGENDYLKRNRMPGRLPGIHLNPVGRTQAESICTTLKDAPIEAIYCSPLERALETAQPLAEEKKLAILSMPELVDTDVGEWTGRSWKALRRMKCWQVIQQSPSQFTFPGGESFAQVQARIVSALEKIAERHKKDELAAVFFHADPIKLALAYFLDMPLDRFQRLTAETGSISIVRLDGSSRRLLGLNLHPPFSFPKI